MAVSHGGEDSAWTTAPAMLLVQMWSFASISGLRTSISIVGDDATATPRPQAMTERTTGVAHLGRAT
ncbi:uncharacterized protein J3R85_016204 [Psidium guajava]|nr:uncharacterized protein J3R85_016204 [Psidium guajava]